MTSPVLSSPILSMKPQQTAAASPPERCGCYSRNSAAVRVWCVYLNPTRSKKTAHANRAGAGSLWGAWESPLNHSKIRSNRVFDMN